MGWSPWGRAGRAMARLRVLHVAAYYDQAWAYGGIPRVVAAQARGLVAANRQVTVATTDACSSQSRLARPEPGGRLKPFATTDDHGVEVRVFPNLSNRIAYRLQFFMPVGLDRFLAVAAPRFDVAHLHGFHNLLGAIAARRLVRAGVPYVLQPNGTAPLIERRRLAKLLFDTILGRQVMRDASALIAVTKIESQQLLRRTAAPVVVVPNPLDLAEFAGLPPAGGFRSRYQLGTAPVVLYLGQISPRKRVDIAVRAVAEIGDPALRLVIAGSDMGRGDEIRDLVKRLGLASRCLFTGVLEGPQRLAALADADVVVYPSRDEIFGLVPLEAILCGTPVVVSGDCGCGEVITSTGGGLVVEYGSTAAVGQAITRILAAPQAWQDPVARATATARQRFGSGAVCDQLQELYDGLVAQR